MLFYISLKKITFCVGKKHLMIHYTTVIFTKYTIFEVSTRLKSHSLILKIIKAKSTLKSRQTFQKEFN